MTQTNPGGLLAFQSDRVEDLVGRLVLELARDEKRRVGAVADRPFVEHLVVVPTRNLEDYLTFEIAARRGVVANVEFVTIERFLQGLLPVDDADEPGVQILNPIGLTRQILALLDTPEITERPALRPVREFIFPFDDAPAPVVERRKFQLAFRIARLFEEYGYARQNVLAHWRRGESGLEAQYGDAEPTEADLQIERWQMALWRELFDDGGPWMMLPDAVFHFARHADHDLQWPASVHLFGHSYLPRFFRDLFSTRSHVEEKRIALYVMTPCLEFWSHGVAGDRDEDPVFEILTEESLLAGDEYPLALDVWGRAGRDFQRMLDDVAYDRVDVSDRSERASHTLLQQFQAMIRDMETARTVFDERPLPADAKSVNFWSCASVQRECEAIASEIWEMVTTHDELRFNDIAVVVQPGDRTTYQTHLQAAFARTGGIPCNVIDVEAAEASPFLEATRLLLELPLSQFRRRELLALLVHPCVVANHAEADEDAWMGWCDAVNIFQGGGVDELDDTYLTEDRFTWSQGMRRLVLGAFMSQPDPERPRPVELDGQRYLPHETSHQQMDTVALLTMLADELIRRARDDREQTRPLAEWMEHFADQISRHLQPRDRRERRTRMHLLGELGGVAEDDTCPDREVGYRTAFDFAMAAMSKMEETRGQYLADGVVISAFRPMRPIPFEVVFVTGLGEGNFPAPDPPDMLDLRRVKSEMHDVNPRYRDQYMFLETLISTRSRLYLSWVGRHAITGEPLEPASAVHQIREMILEMAPNEGGDAERIRRALDRRVEVVEHPLRRYDDRYFPDYGEEEEKAEPEIIDARGPDAIPPGPESARKEGTPNRERRWPNHHREARREAHVRAVRRRISERLPEGARPSMQQFRQVLDPADFETLADAVQWCAPQIDAHRTDEDPVVLRISQVRKFLESPLQGSARVVLHLYDEDDDDVLDADHEPFEAECLTRLMLVRRTFERALVDGDLSATGLERAFDDESRAARLAGELPAGLFFDAEREKCLGELEAYARPLDGEEFDGRLHRMRFGTARRRREVDEQRDPLVLDVDIAGTPTTVELHGVVDYVERSGERFSLQLARSTPKAKYAVRGGFEQILLRAAGLPAEGQIRVATTRKYAKSYRIADQTADESRQYLQGLIGQLLGGVHDYFFPVELAEELIQESIDLSDPGAFRRRAEAIKSDEYSAPSSQYGPVSRWRGVDPPGVDEAREYVRVRFAPFVPALKA